MDYSETEKMIINLLGNNFPASFNGPDRLLWRSQESATVPHPE
jgi:hypothetical protein